MFSVLYRHRQGIVVAGGLGAKQESLNLLRRSRDETFKGRARHEQEYEERTDQSREAKSASY
jgi:hypothetical protein